MTSSSRGFLPSNPQPRDPAAITDWVTIGTIVAAFGLHGEIKMHMQTDFPEQLTERTFLYLGPQHHPYTIHSVRPHGTVLVIHFAEITNATQASLLRGLAAMIPQDESAVPGPDQYYIHDLIGLQAMHIDGHALGTVVDVFTNGAQDLLKIRRMGAADVFVPFVKALVPTVDMQQRCIVIDPPIGLFDGEPE